MNNVTPAPLQNNQSDDHGIGFIQVLIVLAKHKKLVIGLPLAVMLAAAAFSLFLPDGYKASARLLPPQQPQTAADLVLLSELGGFAGPMGGGASFRNSSDIFVAMLNSRTVADKLIEQFDLKRVYGVPSQEMARKVLEKNTYIKSGKDGLITVEVEGEDKKLVAPLANGYVAEVLKLTKVLTVTEAGQRRMFFERQLEQAKNNLSAAELALKTALDSRGANDPAHKLVQEELNSLAESSKPEGGVAGKARRAGMESRQAALGNIKELRDVKYYQMLYELLGKQYEAARLDEAKDAPNVQVLDNAVEPEQKVKPARASIVLLSGLSAFVLALIGAFLAEARRTSLRDPRDAAKWAELKAHLLSR